MATSGTLVRNAVLVELGSEVMHLLDAGLDHLKLDVFFQADGQGVHVATIHATVGEEALKGDAE